MTKVGIRIDEYQRLFSVIPQKNYERDALLYRLMWNLGGRVSEILRIRAEDIQKTNRNGKISTRIKFNVSKRKQRYEKDTFISDSLALSIDSYLRSLNRESNYIFTITRQEVFYMCRRDGLNIGRPDLSPHLFRHGLAQYLMNVKGISPNIVADRLGHSSVRTTLSMYGFVSDRDRESVIDILE